MWFDLQEGYAQSENECGSFFYLFLLSKNFIKYIRNSSTTIYIYNHIIKTKIEPQQTMAFPIVSFFVF